MSEPDGDDSGPHWDEVVDVICVGSRPGVLAYGLCCAAADLDVLVIGPPTRPDPVLNEFTAAMTEDLGDPEPDSTLSVNSVCPALAAESRTRDDFVGPRLRDWSARCLASPLAVLLTEVSEVLVPMLADDGEPITAAVLGGYHAPPERWLRGRAAEEGLTADGTLAALVLDGGRIAGVQLADGSTVAATSGLALPIGPESGAAETVDAPDLEVAVVGRPFGRFARVELLRR
jgi:hypothetical protein